MICKNYVGRPLHSFNKCRKFLLSSLETFFCRNLKMSECHFWTDVMLRQPRIWASRACPVAGFEGGLFQKLFKGYIFCFLGQ